MKKHLCLRLSTIALLSSFIFATQATNTKAAGFYNNVYTDVGRAFAGDVAGGYDASTVYANPAGMMLLPCSELKGGVGFIFPRTQFNNQATAVPAGINVDSNTNTGGNPSVGTLFIPNLYAVYPYENWALGLGVTTPFTTDNAYDNEWIGRFNRITTRIETVDILPSVAFNATDWLSVGVGLNIRDAHVNLEKGKTVSDDFLAAAGVVPSTVTAFQAAGGILPEFRTKFKDNDWALGVNVGLVAKVNECFKLGLDFLSGTSHSLENTFTTSSIAGGQIPALDAFNVAVAASNTLPAQADLKLPNILTFGGSWDVDPCWNIGAQVQWFNWSRFDQINVTSQTGGIVLDTLNEQFQDTFNISLGTQYQVLNNLAVQAGFMYDQSPSRDGFRSPAIPDADRYWATTGVTLTYKPGLSATVGYAHIFMNEQTVNVTNNAAIGANITGGTANSIASGVNVQGVNNTTVIGSFNQPIDILSVSLRMNF